LEAVIPHALVRVTNSATGLNRAMTTDTIENGQQRSVSDGAGKTKVVGAPGLGLSNAGREMKSVQKYQGSWNRERVTVSLARSYYPILLSIET
jgi:hypothetical protein